MESFIQVTEGAGKKLRTWQRSIGGQNVEEEVVHLGEPFLPTYLVAGEGNIQTQDSHLMQLMAGAAKAIHIKRIQVRQLTPAPAAGITSLAIVRLSSAGTGGAAPQGDRNALDPSDPACSASAQTLPTTKGIESIFLFYMRVGLRATDPIDTEVRWEQLPNSKPLVVPAGVSNGIAVKAAFGNASLLMEVRIELVEVGP